MRERLLDAAVDCLFELGYGGTTTIEVAARAGVSRGAQLHHFPTKERLMSLCVRHLLAKRLGEFREAIAPPPAGAPRHAAAVDGLSKLTSSRSWYAWIELVVAARADAELGKTIAEVEGQFREEVDTMARELFPPADTDALPFPMALAVALSALQGLALDRVLWGSGHPRHEVVVRGLKQLLATRRPGS